MREGFAANDGTPTVDNESLNGRMVPIYNDVNAPLEVEMSKTATTMQLVGMGLTNQYGINIGDYLSIDDEIVRIRSTVRPHSSDSDPSNPITVFRAVLGTKAAVHPIRSVVRRVKPLPVELRRHSINRVAGHTFEYVGFGPGNYSTALPEKQDRTISETEELLGQSLRKNGGINYFTGMNDKGIFYSGNKKLNSVTGKEEVFNTPIRSVTGEDISVKKGINLVKATEGDFSQSIKIDGGDQGKAISEFKGPVVFSNKVTSSSTKGLEATSLFLQGESTVSRKYTVGIATPTDAGTPGDITFKENPEGGKYLGWVYTTDNLWKRFGSISTEANYDYHNFDRVLVGTTIKGHSAADELTLYNSGNGGITLRNGSSSNGNIYFSDATSGTAEYAGYVQYQHSGDNLVLATSSTERVLISGIGSVGFGTAAPRCVVDLKEGHARINTFMILPQVSSTVGLGTTAGAMMFNTATSKFQGFTGAAWVDLH